ncbi:MAG: TolC family outer membrane protein [Pseudomonadota bacterium]
MKRPYRLTASAALLCLPALAGAESLLEVYQQALQSDPLVREAEANRLAAEEASPQARGALLPQITASGQYQDSTSDGNNVFVQQVPDPVTGDLIFVTQNTQRDNESEQTSWQVELTQTLFRWDQYVELKRAGKRVAQAFANYEAAQQDLIVRVSERYFNVLAAQDSLAAASASKRAIARQLDQAKQRFDVGLIAITDVQESQAAYDQAVADEISAKRNLATAREFLREITGVYSGDLEAPQTGLPLILPQPSSANEWVATAIDQNLTLQASRLNSEIAKAEISSRRSGHYPSVSFFARYSEFDDNATQELNNNGRTDPADAEQTTEAFGIQFSVPLFAGGTTSSRVREAVYLHRAAREQLQRVARETERAARDAYLGVETDIARVQALTQSLSSSQTALEATEAGLEVGTRTTVDVLDAQRNVFNAFTSLERARYDYLLNVLRLKQAAGTLRVQDLEAIEAYLEVRGPENVPRGIRTISEPATE